MIQGLLIAALVLGLTSAAEAQVRPNPNVQQKQQDMNKARIPIPRISSGGFIPHEWMRVGLFYLELVEVGDVVLDGEPTVGAVGECRFVRLHDRGQATLQFNPTDRKTIVSVPGYMRTRVGGISEVDQSCQVEPSVPLKFRDGRPFVAQTYQSVVGGTSPPGTLKGQITFTMAGHIRETVTNTARMRNWMKPHESIGCSSDDNNGKLGVRVVTGPAGMTCRADYITPWGRSGSEQNFNQLPEGVVPVSAKWTIEGDRNICQLCPDPLQACHGLATVFGPGFPYSEVLYGSSIREGMVAMNLAIWSVPPITNENVMVPGQIIVGYNRDKKMHAYMLPMSSQMSCKAWVPPPTEVAKDLGGAAKDAFGSLKKGEAPGPPPPPPAAPRLRLVLDEMIFLKPPSVGLPF